MRFYTSNDMHHVLYFYGPLFQMTEGMFDNRCLPTHEVSGLLVFDQWLNEMNVYSHLAYRQMFALVWTVDEPNW